jgi:hypothetical protein
MDRRHHHEGRCVRDRRGLLPGLVQVLRDTVWWWFIQMIPIVTKLVT